MRLRLRSLNRQIWLEDKLGTVLVLIGKVSPKISFLHLIYFHVKVNLL